MSQVGEATISLKFDTKSLAADMNSAEKTVQNAGTSSGRAFGDAWSVAAGALIAKSVAKIATAVSSQLDNAIARVDTLNNSQKVFNAMGYAADDVSKSMDTLKTYLDGLPTSMTSAVSNVQSLSASFGGIEKGTEIFIDMNNAGLAFGATSAQIDNAITQLGQLSMDGPLDAQTWNSLRNSGFGPVFAAMAKEAGITVGQLKEDFGGRGSKTVGEFLEQLHKLGTEGGAGMDSLAELARKNTAGIGTAFENVQNRISKAIAKVIDHIGAENISGVINNISSHFGDLADVIVGAMDWIAQNWNVIEPILIGVTTFFTGLLAMGIAQKVFAFLTTLGTMLMAHPILAIISAVAAGAMLIIKNWTPIVAFFNGVFSTIGELCGNAFDGIGKGAEQAWNTITTVFGTLAQFFGNIFTAAWTNVKNVFSTGGQIFMGIVDGILNAFKAIVNTIIRGINSVVAIPFNGINGFLSFLRGIDILGLHPFEWVQTISVPQIPYLATGGIVPDTKGGQLIVAGEGGEDEWVVPESKMASLISQINAGLDQQSETASAGRSITVNMYNNIASGLDADEIGQRMLTSIRRTTL